MVRNLPVVLTCFIASFKLIYILGDVPTARQYLNSLQKLVPSFIQLNLFDGPSDISSAPIDTPINVTKPSREEMLYYNYYADVVYCVFEIKTMDCDSCSKIKEDITEFVVLENTIHDTLALVALAEARKEIVVAFRGSQNIWNYVLDAFLIDTNSFDGKIKMHRGFYIAAMSLYDKILEAIETFRSSKEEHESYKIVLTGHSLGAAMARITEFLYLHFNLFPCISMEVYTYGEPRSGNKHYVDFLNSQNVKTARVTHRADIVCHNPPTSFLGTIFYDYYHHVLTEYWIDDSGETFCNQSMYEDPTCANSLGPLYNALDHEKYFVNHLRCLLTDAHEFLAIPVVFNPPDVLPPIPKPIRNALSEFSDFYMNNSVPLVPLLG